MKFLFGIGGDIPYERWIHRTEHGIDIQLIFFSYMRTKENLLISIQIPYLVGIGVIL